MVAEQNGNHLRECWTEVLRCVSRFELLQQLTAGVPTDALLFAMPDKAAAGGGSSAGAKLKQRILRGRGKGDHHGEEGLAHDSFSSINDMGLHMGGWWLGGDSWWWVDLGVLCGCEVVWQGQDRVPCPAASLPAHRLWLHLQPTLLPIHTTRPHHPPTHPQARARWTRSTCRPRR